jgi:hypothetical protein
MLNVTPTLVRQYGADFLTRLTGPRSTATGVYVRENGDRTSPVTLAQHAYWASRDWTLVEVTDLGGMAPGDDEDDDLAGAVA